MTFDLHFPAEALAKLRLPAVAQRTPFAVLEGSERQKTWATTLREAFYIWFGGEMPPHIVQVLLALRTIKEAPFWINNRQSIYAAGAVTLPEAWCLESTAPARRGAQPVARGQDRPIEVNITLNEEGRYEVQVIFDERSGGVLRLSRNQMVQLRDALVKELQ